MKEKRDATADFAKGVAMLGILLDHIVGQGYIFATFHVPIFFILSGYFCKDEPIGVILKKKAKGLLLPYFLICFLSIALDVCRTRWALGASWEETGRRGAKLLLQTLSGNVFYLTWFLMALFVGTILMALFRRLSGGRVWLYAAMAVGCSVVGYACGTFFEAKPFQWDAALFAMPFLTAGSLAAHYRENVTKKMRAGLFFLCLPLWAIGCLQGGLAMAIRSYPNYPFCVCAAMAGSYCVICFSLYAKRIPLLGTYMAWIGRNTLKFLALGNITKNVWDWDRICPVRSPFLSFLIQAAVFSLIVFDIEQAKNRIRRSREWSGNSGKTYRS